MTNAIYHITSAGDAERAVHDGIYAPAAFDIEGFIHCSYARQICAVANRRFTGRRDLVLLEIDQHRLRCAVIDENLEGGSELFPHVYDRLPMTAVVRIHPFPSGSDGVFELPTTVCARRQIDALSLRGE